MIEIKFFSSTLPHEMGFSACYKDYQEVANRSGVVVSVMIQGVNISHCQLIVTSDNCQYVSARTARLPGCGDGLCFD